MTKFIVISDETYLEFVKCHGDINKERRKRKEKPITAEELVIQWLRQTKKKKQNSIKN